MCVWVFEIGSDSGLRVRLSFSRVYQRLNAISSLGICTSLVCCVSDWCYDFSMMHPKPQQLHLQHLRLAFV